MREIKFRVIHENEIVGYEYLTEYGWRWNWIELNPNKGERWSRGVIEDSTSTAMFREQYTGLKDRKDKDVYEGDIIKSPNWNPSRYKVIFQEGEFCFVSFDGGENPYTNPIHYVNYFEVIGNIHENPELINPK